MICALCGCSLFSDEKTKLRDLDFTVLSEEKIPMELKELLDAKKAEAFKFTYSDKKYLYICIGYGEQATGGYSIAVNELYLAENAVYVSTALLGPDAGEKSKAVPSYPYIVVKTEFLDQTVVFE